MHRFARLTGVYFGLVEPTPEERAREPRPAPLWRQALAVIITLAILAGLAFLFGHTVWGAVRFVLVGVATLVVVRLWHRYQADGTEGS